MRIIIIGYGIAGISAAYNLKQNGFDGQIIEYRKSYGGLLDFIYFNVFRFDRAINLSFADHKNYSIWDKGVKFPNWNPRLTLKEGLSKYKNKMN